MSENVLDAVTMPVELPEQKSGEPFDEGPAWMCPGEFALAHTADKVYQNSFRSCRARPKGVAA